MRLIDADAAIDTLKELTANGTNKGMVFGEDAVHRIEMLPSIQPDTTTHDSIPAEKGKKVLIDRQEALEAIGTMQTYKLFAGDDMLLIDQAEAQTELMMLPPVQPEQRWIPCSERQPDKEGDYLVTLLDDGRTWAEIALWNETFGGHWQAVLYNDVDYSDISNVIAWMPLPEPYK